MSSWKTVSEENHRSQRVMVVLLVVVDDLVVVDVDVDVVLHLKLLLVLLVLVVVVVVVADDLVVVARFHHGLEHEDFFEEECYSVASKNRLSSNFPSLEYFTFNILSKKKELLFFFFFPPIF